MERNIVKKVQLFSALIIAGLLSAAAAASHEGASLKEVTRNLQSVKADFFQKRVLPILAKPLLSEGRFFYDASGSLRWEYLSPIRSVMLQKGDTLKLYQFSEGEWKPDLTPAVESRRMVLAEISRWFQGRFDESKAFRHRYAPGPPARIILIPREGVDKFIQRIEIVLSAKSGVIDRVEIEEPGGSRTSIEFKKVEINSKIPTELFEKP
jgi:outer membrane lipoprotein carrier protein